MIKLSKCLTKSSAEALVLAAMNSDNSGFRAAVGISVDSNKTVIARLISSVLSNGLHSHSACYLDIVRPNRQHGKNILIEDKIKEAFFG